MGLFDEVKQNVTVRQAAEMYGLKPNRSGMICCIFHNDKSPSMKVDRRYYCFGCGCTGDAIDFTAQLFGLGLKEAAQKLADDFGIAYGNRNDGFERKPVSVKKPEPTPEEKWQSEYLRCLRTYLDYRSLLLEWKVQYAPKNREEEWDKGKKYVVRSHMSDKAYKKAHEKVSEEVKKLAHSSDDNAQFMQLQKYNSVVAGLHEYYCISTEVSHDFSRLAFSINKQLRNRLKGDLSKKGQLRNGFIKEKYGASRQMRFLHGRPVVPLGYVQSKNAQHKRKSINKYTVKGREQIHKNLAIDTATMLWLMRNPVKGRTIEYADNRISLYAAQYGKCAVTGIPMNSHDIHCHHKVPVSNGGSDEYANLILVSKAVHILIHASSEPTIEKYLKSLNLDNKQIEKLNKLRTMAEMPPIIL